MKLSADASSLSRNSKRILISRFNEHKRFNGFCLGRRLCLDNLGRSFDRERFCTQIKQLVPDIVDIRFAGVTLEGLRHYCGWCCIEFSSVDAAVAAMEQLDDIYIRIGESRTIFRPLLPHFPVSLEQLNLSIPFEDKEDSDPVALHLGQPTSVNIESREFIRLNKILNQIKQTMLEKGKEALLSVLRQSMPDSTGRSQEQTQPSSQNKAESSNRLLLSDVPARVTDAMLFSFFKFHDSEVDIVRVSDPVTQESSSHVIVTLSSEEKARLISYDINRHMLLSDGFRPIKAKLFDGNSGKGFESLFDRCLTEAGVSPRESTATGDLVQIKDDSCSEERTAREARAALDKLQHSRHHHKKLKRKHQLALHNHIVTRVTKTRKRFDELVEAISTAEKLGEQQKEDSPVNCNNS